jgi:uncharacterized membrane protein
MAPLIILIFSFLIFFSVNHLFFENKLSVSFLGRSAMAIMLVFTALAHFNQTEYMVEMLPDFMPYKKGTVYITGIIEFLAAIGLFIRKTVKITSYLLILFYLLILPANIIGSIKQVDLGGMDAGAPYLFFRIPLQILFMIWIYYFGIMKLNNQESTSK